MVRCIQKVYNVMRTHLPLYKCHDWLKDIGVISHVPNDCMFDDQRAETMQKHSQYEIVIKLFQHFHETKIEIEHVIVSILLEYDATKTPKIIHSCIRVADLFYNVVLELTVDSFVKTSM